MYIHEALDIVESRFLTNLPDSELQHADRLFFQIEQAHWFYEDFIADNNDNLPHFTLKQFATKMFAHSDMFRKMQDKCMSLFNDFSAYRKKIPVFGCCILNPEMTKVALQCSWNGKSWSWPKGKVNEGEDAYKCAIRETFEETGFDASYHCDEEHFIAHYEDQKLIKLYLALDVPEDTVFIPQTRKEVSKVDFHFIDKLPNTYGVHAFIPKLKRWICTEGKKIKRKMSRLENAAILTHRIEEKESIWGDHNGDNDGINVASDQGNSNCLEDLSRHIQGIDSHVVTTENTYKFLTHQVMPSSLNFERSADPSFATEIFVLPFKLNEAAVLSIVDSTLRQI